MKLLIDSCVAGTVADRLRADGHDVVSMVGLGADPGDKAVLALAVSQLRIVITIDSDFGALVFRDGAPHSGVLRLRERKAAALADRAASLIATYGNDLAAGAFVTDDGDSERVTL